MSKSQLSLRFLTAGLIYFSILTPASASNWRAANAKGYAHVATGLAVPETARAVRLVPVSGPADSDVIAEIEMVAHGNEAGFQTSVHFDPAVVSISNVSGVSANPDIMVGSGAPAGTILNVNAESAGGGDIGIVANFNGANTEPSAVVAAGTNRIIRVRFHILANAAQGVSPVTFTNNVISTLLFDDNALLITAPTYVDGSVTVTAASSGGRELKIGSSLGSAGGTATIPVVLTATGTEFGVSLTANWDPTKLDLTGVLGFDVFPGSAELPASCTTLVNNNGVAEGRLGIKISCPDGGIPAGADEMTKLEFGVKDVVAVGERIPVAFGSTPIITEVGDAYGNGLLVDKVSGSVTVVPSVGTPVSVSGRVMTPFGNGLRNAEVTLTDSDGESRTITSSSFGFYQLDNVESGKTYTMSIKSRSYRFDSRLVTVNGNLTDLDCVGVE